MAFDWAGLISGLGGLFGRKSSQSFDKNFTSTTNASGQDLSPELLKALEGLFMGEMGAGRFGTGADAIQGRLGQLQRQAKEPQFDVSKYVKGIMDQAGAMAGLELESGINNTAGNVGGSVSGNSMAALLANKMRNITASNLAGIGQQATASGEQIRMAQQEQLTQGISGLGGMLQQAILGLIGATRGASVSGTSTTTGREWGTIKGKSGGIFG